MDQIRLRSIILNIQDRLSKDDRIRLHFYLGDDVPRRIRDDPSLAGTLSLMDSLFDQDKINEENCSYLINAFQDIHCVDAAKLLREYLNRNQKDGLNQSMQSLSLIMPHMLNQVLLDQDEDEEEEEEDRQAIPLRSMRQENICDDNNITINRNNINVKQDSLPIIVNNRRQSLSSPRKKQLLWKYFVLFVLFSTIIHAIVISFCLWNYIRLQSLNRNYSELMEMVQRTKTNHTETVQIMAQLSSIEMKNTTTILSILKDTSINKWKQYASTVAGGNGYGEQLNQLSLSRGIFIDTDRTMYITDAWNHRIMKWRNGEKRGEIIAGGNGNGSGTDQLSYPSDVVVDKRNNVLIIADRDNRRVMRWSLDNNTKPEVFISDIGCWGLAIDKDGSIYIVDHDKHEVRRWKKGEKEGEIVAGGNGQGANLNQLDRPAYIFVDNDYSLYIADEYNHRVMKWRKDAKQGVVVAGGNGSGKNFSQLSLPQGVIVDRLGRVYVADYFNSRVMRWSEGSAEGEVIVGGNGTGEQSNQLILPTGLSFDVEGNLYVADQHNHRIQKFEKDID